MNVQPTVPNVPTTEGGGGTGTGGGTGGGGDNGDNGGVGGSGTAGDGEVMVCLELASGNLQRNVTLTAMTVSSPLSTGNHTFSM